MPWACCVVDDVMWHSVLLCQLLSGFCFVCYIFLMLMATLDFLFFFIYLSIFNFVNRLCASKNLLMKWEKRNLNKT